MEANKSIFSMDEHEYDTKEIKYDNKCTFSSCDFPGVLEEEKRLAGTPLGLHGLSGRFFFL